MPHNSHQRSGSGEVLAATAITVQTQLKANVLERTLEDELTLTALRMALERRKPIPGLVHHSDRGVQYASRDYTRLLE
jgi:transposase InsO family protein